MRRRRWDDRVRKACHRARTFQVETLECRSLLATFTVTNNQDRDQLGNPVAGSLRQAILDANSSALPVVDVIHFNLPDTGPITIRPTSALPPIADPVIIDGYTQSGTRRNTRAASDDAILRIVLDGGAAGPGVNGLTITAGGSTVRGLAITGFRVSPMGDGGNGILLQDNGGNVIEGNFIGTIDSGNGGDGVSISVAGNTVGGSAPGARNVISGNARAGVLVRGGDATGNLIQGNFIGTDAGGTAVRSNFDGVELDNAPGNTIGPGNVISGNAEAGVLVRGGDATGNLIQGNFIGTDAGGTAVRSNFDGVQLDNAPRNTIGGTEPEARNVISGNAGAGVFVTGDGATGNLIQGNFIGTDITGTADPGNSGVGTFIFDAVLSSNGAGDGPGIRSAQAVFRNGRVTGVALTFTFDIDISRVEDPRNYRVVLPRRGQRFGTPNGRRIGVRDATYDAAMRTVTVTLAQPLFGDTRFGLTVVGTGVSIQDAPGNTIGGTEAGAGNVIAFHTGAGVGISSGTGNSILANSIFSNTGLGIDLDVEGPTPNTPIDAGTLPDVLQSFPVLTVVPSIDGARAVRVTLNSIPDTAFRIELFASVAADPSGFGEGQSFLISQPVTTDSSGHASIPVPLPSPVPAGQIITATATRLVDHDADPSTAPIPGDTSEFSEGWVVASPGRDPFAAAVLLDLSPAGILELSGMIEIPGAVDVFRFRAQATGTLTVQQGAAGSDLDSFLEVFAGDGDLITSNDDETLGSLDSLVQFNVQEGQEYFVRAAGFGRSTGPYLLSFRPRTAALPRENDNTFRKARLVVLTASGYGSQAGSIQTPGDEDFFRFRAPATGTLTVRLVASEGNLAGHLTVFNRARGVIAQAELGEGEGVRFDAVAGQTYFLRVGAREVSTGAYELLFNDNGGSTFESAEPVKIDGEPIIGSIDFAGDANMTADADVFRFVAPVTGLLRIRQERIARSELDSLLFVLDNQRRLIASNDNAGSLSDPAGAAVVVNVARGQVFYVWATSSARHRGPSRLQTGPYRLSIEYQNDDSGATFDDAQAVEPVGTTTGTIDRSGDEDLFAFDALESGRLSIRLAVDPDAPFDLDPVLVAFDRQRSEIQRNDDAAPGDLLNSLVQLNVTEGRRYYLRVSGFGPTAGRYRLTFDEIKGDDRGSDLASATPVPLSSAGAGAVSGVIEDGEDVDVFAVEVPAGRRLVVELIPEPGSELGGELLAFTYLDDGIPTQVASDRTRAGHLEFDADGDRTYFLRVVPSGSGSGGYHLTIRTGAGFKPSVAFPQAGKATFEQLRESFLMFVPRIGPTPEDVQRAVDAINADLAQRLLASFNGRPPTDLLSLWFDPVDFRLTAPGDRLAGYTADKGAINEQGGGYYSGSGVLQLLIVPQAIVGNYSLELIGVGPDPVLFGIRMIAADGTVSAPMTSFAGELPIPIDRKQSLPIGIDTSLSVILDPPAAPPPPTPSPPGSSGPSGPDQTVVAGIAAALQSQIQAGGGLPSGSGGVTAGGSAATAGVALAVVPLQLVPSGLGPGAGPVAGAGPEGATPRDAPTTRGQVLSNLARSLWNGPLGTAWTTLRGAVAAVFKRETWAKLFEGWIRATAGPLGRLDPAGPRTRHLLAGVEEPPGGEGHAAGPQEDAGDDLRASVAVPVVVSALGLIRTHRPDGSAKGRAIVRRKQQAPGSSRAPLPGEA